MKPHLHAILNWLETLLFERFGHHFELSFVGDYYRLGLSNTSSEIRIFSDLDTFGRSDSNLDFSSWNAEAEGWSSVLSALMPAPGVAKLPAPLITKEVFGHHIKYDVLGLTYWMLTRQEEIGRTDLDAHKRFLARSSHAFKFDYLSRPIVDEWLDLLGQVIQRNWPSIEMQKNEYSIQVSHDVDAPSRYAFRSLPGFIRAVGGDLVRGKFRDALAAPLVRMGSGERIHPWDPLNSFEWLMDVSDAHNLKSSFYFICGRTNERMDADYDLSHPAIRTLMRTIHRRGHEIGLHPSYETFRDPGRLAQEASELKRAAQVEGIVQKVWGGRMHYLRWEQACTLRAWDAAGMHYDGTLGYADQPGFRCGTCYEYQAFDPEEGRSLSLRVRPLIAMDATLLGSTYLNLGSGLEVQKRLKNLKDICRIVGGCFSLLWHNSSLRSADQRSLYVSCLRD